MSLMPITQRQRPLLGLTLEQLAGAAPPPTADLDAGFAPAQPQHPSFFQQGGLGRHIAGALGDVLMQYGGLQPVYAPMQRERQQAEQQEVQWQRRRQAENEDWRSRQDYELTHRPPPQPTEFERMLQASGVMPGTPQWAEKMGQRVNRQLDEPDVVVTLPNGQLYIGPKSGLGTALGGGIAPVAPPPKSELTPVTGGAGGNASGGFPYR